MTTSRVATYSADEVTLSFAGYLIDSGFADGEFVSIEPAAEDFVVKKGADGETARAKTNNRDANVKIKLLQTSLGNDVLSQIRQLDLNGTNGAGVGVFQVRDRSSGVLLAHSDKAWIAKPPTIARAREVSEYEWTLYAANCDLDPSGNPSI